MEKMIWDEHGLSYSTILSTAVVKACNITKRACIHKDSKDKKGRSLRQLVTTI